MTVTVTTTRATMDDYLEALTSRGNFAVYFTDDVTFELIGTDQVINGRSPVEEFIRYAHETAFDSTVEVRTVTVDEDRDRCAVELVFSGPHTGDFVGIGATGKEVRVPYSAYYDLTDDGISAVRVYGVLQELISALSP